MPFFPEPVDKRGAAWYNEENLPPLSELEGRYANRRDHP